MKADRTPEKDINNVNRNSGVGSINEQLANLNSIFDKTAKVLKEEKEYKPIQVSYVYDLARIWTLGGWGLTIKQKEEMLGFDFESFSNAYRNVGFKEEEREYVRSLAKNLSNEAKGLKNIR